MGAADVPEAQALGLQWAFGISSDVRGGMASLTGPDREAVVYVAAHTAVIYDKIDHTQTVLQGHCNPITCLAVSPDGSTIVTADAGEDSMLVLWDAYTGVPRRTISSPHALGIVALDISADGEHLVTISADGALGIDDGEEAVHQQEISLWELRDELLELPFITANVPPGDPQLDVHFNQEDRDEIVSNGRQRVYFWHSQLPRSRSFKYYSPPISARDFKQTIGDFTTSVFVPYTNQALTGTADGDVVVWEEGRKWEPFSRDRRAVKILRVHHGGAVNCLRAVERYVVSGGSDGYVRFYDSRLRLSAWFEELDAGGITSVSFSGTRSIDAATGLDSSEEADQDIFSAPDFVVATSEGKIVAVQCAAFEELSGAPLRAGSLLLQGTCANITAVAAHPSRPLMVVMGEAGLVQCWDYNARTLMLTRQLDHGAAGASIRYIPDGSRLAVGLQSGVLKLLRPDTLEDSQGFRVSRAPIVDVAVSSCSRFLATADAACCVALLTFGHGKAGDKWELIGKHRAHTAAVTGLQFVVTLMGETRLLSVGEDRMMIEYDLEGSSIQGGLKVSSATPVGRAAGHLAIPTAMTVLGDGADASLLTADDEFKLRTYGVESKQCRSTVLGPTYGGPLNRLQVFHGASNGRPYLAYSTHDKVVGLATLPLDGDPNKAVGLIAHPGEISSMQVTYDGRKLLTAGGVDAIVNMWTVDVDALDAAVEGAAAGAPRWAALIEGGEGGDFYREIQDYFYYSQVCAQGEDSTEPRRIDGRVLVEEVPNLMRALGYYPSESDVQDMMVQVRHEAEVAGEEAPSHVSFDHFLALYSNYRPVFGVGKEQIQQAFRDLGADADGRLGREELLAALLEEGEAVDREELTACLGLLCGADSIEGGIPESLDAKEFAEEVLGFEDYTGEI